MRVWQISSFGIDSLEFAERPVPEPGPGQVLVKIHAISLNYRDLMMVKGLYNPKLKLPRIPCSDGAGEVIAAGPGVSLWREGDRVAGIFMQNWLDGPPTPLKVKGALGGDIDGTMAEFIVRQVEMLQPQKVVFCHHDAFLPPYMNGTNVEAAAQALRTRTPWTELVTMTYGAPVMIFE